MISRSRAAEILDGFGRCRILVLGDCMLDQYIWGRVSRISPEAPVPIVEVDRSTHTAGGAANVVHNLCSLGARAGIAGVIGEDEAGTRLRTVLSDQGVDVQGLVVDAKRPTTTKTRIIAHSQQLIRTDLERRDPIDEAVARQLQTWADGPLRHYQGLLISDYNKGVLQPALVASFVQAARSEGVLVAAGPKPESLRWYAGAHLVAFNQKEAREAVGYSVDAPEALNRAGYQILHELGSGAVLITRGEHGMALFAEHQEPVHVPALASEVYDVSGAGDTVIATATLARCAGASLEEAVMLANIAAAVVVRKVGTATANREELLGMLE
ncbi:MAG: D-glycero-beta-D-manno-heptose-7-phosphate kinase [Candidatus Xenobia bacterium]